MFDKARQAGQEMLSTRRGYTVDIMLFGMSGAAAVYQVAVGCPMATAAPSLLRANPSVADASVPGAGHVLEAFSGPHT